MGRDDEDAVDLSHWFDDDELSECPRCGARRLLPAGPEVRVDVCLDCGVLPES
jgi:hypothetical protein